MVFLLILIASPKLSAAASDLLGISSGNFSYSIINGTPVWRNVTFVLDFVFRPSCYQSLWKVISKLSWAWEVSHGGNKSEEKRDRFE